MFQSHLFNNNPSLSFKLFRNLSNQSFSIPSSVADLDASCELRFPSLILRLLMRKFFFPLLLSLSFSLSFLFKSLLIQFLLFQPLSFFLFPHLSDPSQLVGLHLGFFKLLFHLLNLFFGEITPIRVFEPIFKLFNHLIIFNLLLVQLLFLQAGPPLRGIQLNILIRGLARVI